MFITAVCIIFLIKLRWPKNKSLYDSVFLVQHMQKIRFHDRKHRCSHD